MNANVQKTIENSPVWKALNESINNLYKENNRVPSEEEYKAVREMIMLRVMVDDENVRMLVANDVYDMINAN